MHILYTYILQHQAKAPSLGHPLKPKVKFDKRMSIHKHLLYD